MSLFGKVLNKIHFHSEKRFLKEFAAQDQREKVHILGEILKYSRNLVFLVFLLFLLCSLFDYFLSLPSVNLIRSLALHLGYVITFDSSTLLEILIGAISAILGIIFALYSISFQISTDKYSDQIIEFINQEKVVDSYFKLLIFTDLFLISVYLKTYIFPLREMVFSLTFVLFLSVLSILGIVVVKTHFFTSMSPLRIQNRILSEIGKYASYLSVHHPKKFFRSYTFSIQCRDKIEYYMGLNKLLLEDLVGLKKSGVVHSALINLGLFFVSFLESKRFFDTEEKWWTFTKSDLPSAQKNHLMYPIQARIENHGLTPYAIQSSNECWVEDEVETLIFDLGRQIKSGKIDGSFLQGILTFYQVTFFGNFRKKTEGGYEKSYFGLLNLQEFDLFEKYFTEFNTLFEDFAKNELLDTYVEILNHLRIEIIGGFKIRNSAYEFLDWREYLTQQIDRYIYSDRPDYLLIHQIDLPKFFKDLIAEYWEKTQAEIDTDNEIVTPKDLLKREIIDKAEAKEEEIQSHYLGIFLENFKKTLEISQSAYPEIYASSVRNFLLSLQQAKDLRGKQVFEQLVTFLRSNLELFTHVPARSSLDVDLIERIERALYPAIFNNDFLLASPLLRLFIVYMQKAMSFSQDDIRAEEIFVRRYLILFGYIYLHAELRGNRSLLNYLCKQLDRIFAVPVFINLVRSSFLIANSMLRSSSVLEFERYMDDYGRLFSEIEALPKVQTVGRGRGFSEEVDHSSRLVRRISSLGMPEFGPPIADFISHLERREAYKTFLSILIKKI